MSEQNKNGKIILIATLICVLIGVGFVFRIDKQISNMFIKKEAKPVVEQINKDNLPNLPNMVVIKAGNFIPSVITIKEGEVVTFYNLDESSHKVIGKDWQTPYIEKTGASTKGDLTKGEYEAYIENLPNNICKIIVK